MRSLVLHVSEAFGGGIISAVAHFARLTSGQFESVLVARRRGAHDTGDELRAAFAEIIEHDGDLLSFTRSVRRVVRERRPAVVHLHSTWAGALGRIALPRRGHIVYSPYCFAFERRDLGLEIGVEK